jgi:hypothetical protein
VKRAKILAACVYEFFEGGNIDTIANSPDKLVWRTNRTTFSDLGKSSIHQVSGEFVVHTPTVAPQALAAVRGELLARRAAQTIKPSNHPSDGYLRGNHCLVLWFDGDAIRKTVHWDHRV